MTMETPAVTTDTVAIAYFVFCRGTSHDGDLSSHEAAHVVLPYPLLLHDLQGHDLVALGVRRQSHLAYRRKEISEVYGNK